MARGKLGETQRAMFVSYAFVNFERGAERWKAAEETPGVWRFLTIEGRPAQLPVQALAAICSKALELEQRWMARKDQKPVGFEIGQRVMAKVGPYADMLTSIERFDDKGRAVVLIDMLGGRREVTVRRAELVAA